MQQRIEQKLMKALDPIHLEVVDESHEHNEPMGAQTNFSVIVVSECFIGKTKQQRHTKVYRALLEELDGMLKTFTVLTFEPYQWEGRERILPLPPEPAVSKDQPLG